MYGPLNVRGKGLEPLRPQRGHLILSQARMTSFATPARRRIVAGPGYVFGGNLYDEGIFFGGVPITIAISWCAFSSSARGSPWYGLPLT
jgi:hypothetical protein